MTNPTPMIDKPLPCPFCGGEAMLKQNQAMAWVAHHCADTMPYRHDDGGAERAIAAWNTRTQPPAAQPSVGEDEIGEIIKSTYRLRGMGAGAAGLANEHEIARALLSRYTITPINGGQRE